MAKICVGKNTLKNKILAKTPEFHKMGEGLKFGKQHQENSNCKNPEIKIEDEND